jgi:carboxyl-terminal processing protease
MLGLAGVAGDTSAGTAATPAGDVHMRAFEEVWTTVRDTHWDPELGGLDWNAVREELEPRMRQVESTAEARDVLQQMLGRLGQSHFQIIPGDVYDAMSGAGSGADDGGSSGNGVLGVEVRPIAGAAVVTSVRSGSPAAEAGIEPGWVVDVVDGAEIASVLDAVGEHAGNDVTREFLMTMAVISRLQGAVGEQRALEVRSGDNRSRRLELELAAPRGTRGQLGHLPPVYVWLEHRRIAGGRVGYIAFNAFFDPATIMPAFEEAIRSFADTDGLVIDVRGNPGGIGAMAMGMAGFLLDASGQRLGTMTTRSGSLDFVVFPRPNPYTGPVAVLADGVSASTAEIFAGGLQELGRAVVVGRRTSGQALPSRVVRLANGDAFQHAFASFQSVSGRSLEGHGVVPDIPVELTRQRLLEDPDPDLSVAVKWIVDRARAQRVQSQAQSGSGAS